MRILVLGGSGMAGHVISTYLLEHGHDVYTIARSQKETEKNANIDATDFNKLGGYIDKINPQVVINCIGLLVKECDENPDKAVLVNAYLPHWLEKKFKDTKTKLIHLSTDCVFSGKRGRYVESDFPDGDTMYDRSKALGEVINDKDLTFRMSIIGPDYNINGVGLFNWFMKQKAEINGFRKAIWNGVTTIELARAIDCAIEQNLTGLYQLAPKESLDKYNLLLLFKEVFNKDVEILPCDDFVVDKTLVNTRTDFDFQIRTYRQQIEDMLDWVKGHKDMYGETIGN